MKQMLKNKICILMIAVLLNSFLLSIAMAATAPSLSFHGVGLTVNLTYPEEAHPNEEIYHNVTITSQTDLTLNNLTLIIYGTVNQTQQEITNLLLSLPLIENSTLSTRINFTIPQETFGRLYCTLYARTSQDTDYLFTSFYTTHVHTITFSELLIDYNQLSTNYTNNKMIYNSLVVQYDNLDINKKALDKDNIFQIEKNRLLQLDYDSLNTNHTNIQETYKSLDQNYTDLNQINTDLKSDITSLQQLIDDKIEEIDVKDNSLNVDRNLMVVFIVILVGLIGLIIYLRNKQKEPYVVIRKETVSVKPKKK